MDKSLKIKFYLVVILVCSLFVAPAVFADGEKKITLNDGSVIYAEILSYSKGVYQLRSKSLGKFSLAEEKVQSIQFPSAGPSAPAPNTDSSGGNNGGAGRPSNKGLGAMIDPKQIDQMKNKIMSDPQASKLVEELQKDPNMQKILADKELVQAIEKGDVNRLASDPKIQALLNNKEIGKIVEQVK